MSKPDKKRYTLLVSGHEAVRAEWTLAEARKELKELLADEVKACRRRFGKATLHRTADTGRITLGRDKDSALWLSAGIVPL